MNNDELMKELEELTKSMEQELIKENTNIKIEQPINPKPNMNNPFSNFNMPFMSEGNEDDYMKELQKLLTNDIQIDENDPESNEMMKLLSNIY